jgi:hypothetical protein
MTYQPLPAWLETNLVSKDLSQVDQDLEAYTGFFQDYATSVYNDHTSHNVDRRVIAIGGDQEMHWSSMVQNPVAGWESNISLLLALNRMFFDYKDSTNILTNATLPYKYTMDALEGGSTNYTFVNDTWLYEMEQFGLTHPDYASYTDTQYSAMDVQDVLAGTNAGTFDLVSLRVEWLVGITTKLVDAYVNMLAVDGIMVLSNTGAYSALYRSRAKLHIHSMTKINRALKKDNLRVYHIPVDQGYTICKRIS